MRCCLVAWVIFMGCTAGHGPFDDPGDEPATGPPVVQFLLGEEEQGRYLLGKTADGLASNGLHVSVVAPPGGTLSVTGQNIVLNGQTGAALRMMQLPTSGTSGRMIRIDDINPFGPGYQLSYLDPGAPTWLPYCDPAESPYAIAMWGEWTISGLHNVGPTPGSRVTFACKEQGKAAKCGEWGYYPDSAASAPGQPGWDLNQACTQMAMANYCMTPVSHTREKTPILIRDSIPAAEPPNTGVTKLQLPPASYPPVPPPPDQYYFEAAWEPRVPVLCLDKLRWNSLKLGGPCPDLLKDPRVVKTARFCEEAPPDLDSVGLWNASRTMDLTLHRWASSSGDTVTTVHGYVVDETRSGRTTVPPTGFNGPPLSDEGFLLRNLTGTTTDGVDVFKVYRQRNAATGDSVVGPADMLTDFTYADPQDSRDSPDFEGYLFIASAPGNQGLYLYVNDSGTDYVTATKWPGAGYHKVGGSSRPPIGYVIAAPL